MLALLLIIIVILFILFVTILALTLYYYGNFLIIFNKSKKELNIPEKLKNISNEYWGLNLLRQRHSLWEELGKELSNGKLKNLWSITDLFYEFLKKVLFFSFIIILLIGIVLYLIGNNIIIVNRLSRPSVRGVTTTIFPTPTTIPVPTPTLTPTPSPTIKPVLYQKQTILQTKQYGGWYWQPELNRAQIWIGTNSAGKDIWIDHFPAPMSTPTQKPATQQQLSSQGNTSGGGESETKVKTSNRLQSVSTGKVYIQSCSNDGTNPSVPKCP